MNDIFLKKVKTILHLDLPSSGSLRDCTHQKKAPFSCDGRFNCLQDNCSCVDPVYCGTINIDSDIAGDRRYYTVQCKSNPSQKEMANTAVDIVKSDPQNANISVDFYYGEWEDEKESI